MGRARTVPQPLLPRVNVVLGCFGNRLQPRPQGGLAGCQARADVCTKEGGSPRRIALPPPKSENTAGRAHAHTRLSSLKILPLGPT
ncbi:hypothetical protein NDU88_007051 [Pleurodeles waltl]|uniref:Uncharacterized protein n=1 Tax=Pleurodeles waltl TaxID=8319 RepID=A0AAV7URB1_PLEWA|nr:hypothetical protein NDU88_007051 [Pleurodeles waltl]